MGRRSKARECALQMLHQWDQTREPMDRVSGLFWKVRRGTPAVQQMAERLARGAQAEVEGLDKAIDAACTHWRLERLAPLDLNLLRVATWELMHDTQTPAAVVIDEAIELAKRFGEADTPPFVNGILDAIRRSVRPEEETRGRRGPRRDE